ncbi:GNAT family N-acetyltransferase [Streptococcus tangpeifui]|uniref:GNAT family N-acetyltransferase n=1 Tax=Streptococcus tangpeifui TaxID=2709400 RepID=UPI0013EB7A37|nr:MULTISPECIES: GNAT family N-acetyltransferase [unclassified Streptococcus]
MIIRQVRMDDFGEIFDIEEANFSEEEAASPQALQERIAIIPDTFLVAELSGRVVAYLVGPAKADRYLTDDLFEHVDPNPAAGGFIQIQSLSVAPKYQGQGLGTALLAALKDLALAQERQGISLTCHAELIPYYEMNGFRDEGLSDSQHGGQTWYNLVWENR